MNHRVNCRWCRFRFLVITEPCDEWQMEAQCPCCENWACFTVADTRDLPLPDPAELEAEAQRIGALLWQPINEYREHPTVKWIDRVGNGLFEDNYVRVCWPVPHTIYRFKRGDLAAYVWQEDNSWFVRGWYPLRSRNSPLDPAEVFSFEAALDHLASEAESSDAGELGND